MDIFIMKEKTKRKEYLSFALFRVLRESPARRKSEFVCELGMIHLQRVGNPGEARKFWNKVTESLKSIGGELGQDDHDRIKEEIALAVPLPEPLQQIDSPPKQIASSRQLIDPSVPRFHPENFYPKKD